MVVLAVLAVAAAIGPAAPAAAPKVLSSYCSPSGDVCYGVFKRSGHVSLEITTAARYFGRYTLCVRRTRPVGAGAASAQRCGSFPVFKQGLGTYGSRINYTKQYPIKTPGTYRVTWKAPAALGPSLQFRLPLR
jgi:hypothetical protein